MNDPGALNPMKESPREPTGVCARAVIAAILAGQSITAWLMVVLVVVLVSGGLFGDDQGVISGALHGINRGLAFLASQSFLTPIGAMGNSLTFWLFALFCGVAWSWIHFRMPETKGQSLEQIQRLWKVVS
jgi:hypothetical protein